MPRNQPNFRHELHNLELLRRFCLRIILYNTHKSNTEPRLSPVSIAGPVLRRSIFEKYSIPVGAFWVFAPDFTTVSCYEIMKFVPETEFYFGAMMPETSESRAVTKAMKKARSEGAAPPTTRLVLPESLNPVSSSRLIIFGRSAAWGSAHGVWRGSAFCDRGTRRQGRFQFFKKVEF